MLTLVHRWFVDTKPSGNYQSNDYLFLGLILALGVAVRFWGLDNVGLHGDEETMAMPAMAILLTGEPYLPSGMYYSRGLLNIYMMSASVSIFGESEWAFRFPSAIVGSLAGLAAFFLGRRFLSPQFNLAFVATVTFLPGMIAVSQTARMYVFFITAVIWFGACVFRWERDQRISSLILALLVWTLALHFQRLAIFAALLFFFPGLTRQSWKLLFQGALSFGAGWALFQAYESWISAQYPQSFERPEQVDSEMPPLAMEVLNTDYTWFVNITASLALVLAAFWAIKIVRSAEWAKLAPVVLLVIGFMAVTMLQYHVGGICLLLGGVFWFRNPELPKKWLFAVLAAAVCVAAFQLGLLLETGLYPGRKLIGAVIGVPSIWPVLRFLTYSPVAGVLYGVFLAIVLFRFSRGQRFPLHVLFFAIAVWAPLLILGYFDSHIPPRYASGQLCYFLLCVFAGLAYVVTANDWIADNSRLHLARVGLLALMVIVIINPLAFAKAINPTYADYPDHKGAAEFVRSLGLSEDAILIAEDILQQTYYLGDVDYSLRPISDADIFSIVVNDRLVDQYTNAPVLGTGEELDAVLNSSAGRPVYIIGSGENWVGDVRLLRSHGISEVLKADRLEVVYEGRDGKTKVWMLRR